MSTLDEPKAIASSESRYRSMFKSSKFIWRSNKTTPLPTLDSGDTHLPSTTLPSSSIPSFGKNHTHTIAFKNEIYELSTINDSGMYLTPILSPSSNSKNDHWLDDDDDALYFFLPSHDCLTTVSGRPHSFYTPSSIIISA